VFRLAVTIAAANWEWGITECDDTPYQASHPPLGTFDPADKPKADAYAQPLHQGKDLGPGALIGDNLSDIIQQAQCRVHLGLRRVDQFCDGLR
jgi:hypothetical protein